MLKQLFILLYKLIAEPTSAWRSLAERYDEGNNESFYRNYMFPIIGIIALMAFVGTLLALERYDLSMALKSVVKQVFVYGGSFYLSAFVTSDFLFPQAGLPKNRPLAERFIGYAFALSFVIAMFTALMPMFTMFSYLIILYCFYLIWVGSSYFLHIKEEFIVKFTVLSGLLIVFSPLIINFLIELCMPGMKIK